MSLSQPRKITCFSGMLEGALDSAVRVCKGAYTYAADTLLAPALRAFSFAWGKAEPFIARVPLSRQGWILLGCALTAALVVRIIVRLVIRALFFRGMDVQDKLSRRLAERRALAAARPAQSCCSCARRGRAQGSGAERGPDAGPFPPMLRVGDSTFLVPGDRLGLPPMLVVVSPHDRLVLYAPHVIPEEQMRELEGLAGRMDYSKTVAAIFAVPGDDSDLYKERYPEAMLIRTYQEWKKLPAGLADALDTVTLVQPTRSAKRVSSCFFLASDYSEEDESFSDTVCLGPEGLTAGGRPRLPCDTRGWCRRRAMREYCETLVWLAEGAITKSIRHQDTDLQPRMVIYQNGEVEMGPEYAGAALLAAAGRLSPKYSERALEALNSLADGGSDGEEGQAGAQE